MSIYKNDCLNILAEMESNTIDMIYLDPPFFTQKKQKLKDNEGKEYCFDDCWKSMEEYIHFLELRIIQCKRVMKENGSLFFHCDSTASAYIKIMLDKVFGYNNFRSEIIWSYKRWSNAKNNLLGTHQIILYYSKTKHFKFNKIYTSYSPTTNIDQILQDRVRDDRGKVVYKVDDDGEIVYTNEKKGVPLSDVWEIPFLNPKAKERVGYPTQKPILLLERILLISTDEGDIVLDPFCGSGSTLVASQLLKRRYVGIDISEDAINLTKKRLENPIKTDSMLMKKGISAYDTKDEYEKKLLNLFDCDIVQRNKGIDGILKKKYNNRPVAIRIQKKEEKIEEAISALVNAGEKKKCSYLIFIQTNRNSQIMPSSLPNNIIILESYDMIFEEFLENYNGNILKRVL